MATTIPVAQDVRQSIYVKNVVTFGYPLPHGHVSALSTGSLARLQNVVPERFWKQLWGNFSPPGGGRERLSSLGPAHNDWPRLHPKGPKSQRSERSLGVEHIPRDERPG